MSTLMSAASDAPRAYTPARSIITPPEFADDGERYAWIAAEYRRRLKLPGVNNGALARDIAADAFGVTKAELCSRSREAKLSIPRQKIVCVISILAGGSMRMTGRLVGRDRITVFDALAKFKAQVAAGLKGGA